MAGRLEPRSEAGFKDTNLGFGLSDRLDGARMKTEKCPPFASFTFSTF